MTDADRAFLFDLLRTPSPTGFEAPGQRVWATRAAGLADRVESDAYGNVWATRTGSSKKAPTILLEAHADEIGFAVKYITDEGFIRVDRIGGSDHAIARGRRLVILGLDGPVPGIIGNTPFTCGIDRRMRRRPRCTSCFSISAPARRTTWRREASAWGSPRSTRMGRNR